MEDLNPKWRVLSSATTTLSTQVIFIIKYNNVNYNQFYD